MIYSTFLAVVFLNKTNKARSLFTEFIDVLVQVISLQK